MPAKLTFVNKHLDGSEELTRVVTWTKQHANEQLPADTFTFEKLKVQQGDLISDHRIRKSWRYLTEGGTPQPPREDDTPNELDD